MKKAFLVALLLLLFGLISASCAGIPLQTASAGTGVLKLYGIDPYTLDPAMAGDGNSHNFIVQIFSGLVKMDDNLQPVPDIAARWDISQDRRTYTFYLRKDARFQDGRQVTAADFKYSWERACNPATGSDVAGTYLGDIAGVKDVVAGKTTQITGVKVISDYVLQVTIEAPHSFFLYRLTYTASFVVDKANVSTGADWWRKPNGTGPFKLTEWQANAIVLERNDGYYGNRAKLKRVEFGLWSGSPMNLYETGQIDVTTVASPYIDRVNDKTGPFYSQLQVNSELSFYWLGFNVNRPPFDDPAIRRAFSLAVDRDKVVSLVFSGMAATAQGILPPGIPGYNSKIKGIDYDVAKAKDMIAKSRYGSVANLPPLVLTTSGYGGDIQPYLKAIIAQWRANLGVEVTVRVMEPERFLYYLKDEKDNMFDMGWIADYPHPQDFLDVLFRSGAENNYGDYSNPAVDSLLDKAAAEPDDQKSLEIYRQAEQALVDDAAVMPLWFGKDYTLVKPYVSGYELNAMGFVWLNEVGIKPH